MAKADPFTGQLLLTEAELREVSAAQQIENLQQRAGELLGDFSFRWTFSTNNLPDLRYETEPLPLADTNRVARLQLKLVAIELEAARAQLTGIKLRYWPELHLFLSGPPVYQRSLGRERFWDADELRASADLFWYIDTRGQISRQLRQTKRQHQLQRARFDQETVTLMEKLLATQSILKNALEKSRQLHAQLTILEAVPPTQNFASIYKYAEDYRLLIEQQRQVRRDIAQLNTLFWFVDENAWSGQASTANPSHASP